MVKKTIIVLVGPSGSGKTSIGEVLEQHDIPRLTTTTTREPRAGEVDGVDYYFRELDDLKTEDFVEQTVYNSNRYGLTINEVDTMLEKHDIVHVSLDQNGADAVKKAFPEKALVVYVQIDEEEMIRRMEKRGDSQAEIDARIAYCRATNELVAPSFTDLIVENIDINTAAQKIMKYLANH